MLVISKSPDSGTTTFKPQNVEGKPTDCYHHLHFGEIIWFRHPNNFQLQSGFPHSPFSSFATYIPTSCTTTLNLPKHKIFQPPKEHPTATEKALEAPDLRGAKMEVLEVFAPGHSRHGFPMENMGKHYHDNGKQWYMVHLFLLYMAATQQDNRCTFQFGLSFYDIRITDPHNFHKNASSSNH